MVINYKPLSVVTQSFHYALPRQEIIMQKIQKSKIFSKSHMKSGYYHIQIEEAGPLIASLRIESSAPGCNSLVRRVRLFAGADWIVEARVDPFAVVLADAVGAGVASARRALASRLNAASGS